jgi:hypothetical protein
MLRIIYKLDDYLRHLDPTYDTTQVVGLPKTYKDTSGINMN